MIIFSILIIFRIYFAHSETSIIFLLTAILTQAKAPIAPERIGACFQPNSS
jgi:hypothetical protein